MEVFEVGEVAIVCNARFHPERNGQEVRVCTVRRILPVRQSDGTIRRGLRYGVVTKEGQKFAVQPWQLRRRRPREALGSWDQCVWRPASL